MSENLTCTLRDPIDRKTLMKMTGKQARSLYNAGLIRAAATVDEFHLDPEATLAECHAELRNYRPTNVEFVTDLMEHSRHGALIQAFVIQALYNFSAKVAALTPRECETTLVCGEAWHGCGVELQEKLKARLT